MFDISHDSHLFRPSAVNGETLGSLLADGWRLDGNVLLRGKERLLPLYEAKMLHHYDHRWTTYTDEGVIRDLTLSEKQDPDFVVRPRYWVSEVDIKTGETDKQGLDITIDGVASRLGGKGWDRKWLLGWRDIAKTANERTAIPFVFPIASAGNKVPLMTTDRSSSELTGLIACQSSFVYDFASRQKVGGASMNFFIWKQLPVLPPATVAHHSATFGPRVLELTYTAHDMTPFARDLGDTGTPFRWDDSRRTAIRAELDALFFHLYGIARDDVSYILDTFPIVKRKDEAAHGTYRTKDLILAEYDRMAAAGLTLETPLDESDSGTYRSTLTPPPGQGPRHPARQDG
jgi:hypothetical protein